MNRLQQKKLFIQLRFGEMNSVLSRLWTGGAENCSAPIRCRLIVAGTMDRTSVFEKLEVAPDAECQHNFIILMLENG